MTSSLPPLLTTRDLPSAELQAAALDGDVFRLDRAFCSIAEFDVPWRRASVFDRSESVIVSRFSAAWVWGGLTQAPATHDCFRVAGGSASDEQPGFRFAAVAVDPSDVVDFGGVRVTNPTRTVVDLCRGDADGDEVSAVVRRLVAEHRVDRAGCNVVLDRARYLPHRRRARARLDALGVTATGPAS